MRTVLPYLLFTLLAAPLVAAPALSANTKVPQKTAQKATKTSSSKKSEAVDYSQREDVQAWAAAFGAQQGIDPALLLAAMKEAQAKPRIIALMDAPVKAPLRWFEYAPRFLNDDRIASGIVFWRTHEATLKRAEAFFGVPPEIVVAIIGVETFYGRNTGGFRVLDALTTLAFDYPRRADYFLSELQEYFLLARDNGFKITSLKGSYAGAMGIGQFMPRSYRHFAIDFDQDGRVDLWRADDAIGSVAFYLQEHGWQAGAPSLTPVRIADDNIAVIAPYVENGLSEPLPWRDWQALGITLSDKSSTNDTTTSMPPMIDDTQRVSLLKLDRDESTANYYLAHDNFRTILRYNKSRLYASAVIQLAAALRQQY